MKEIKININTLNKILKIRYIYLKNIENKNKNHLNE